MKITIDIENWVQDQIDDECIELDNDKIEHLASYLFKHFDCSDIYEQLDHLTHNYLSL